MASSSSSTLGLPTAIDARRRKRAEQSRQITSFITTGSRWNRIIAIALVSSTPSMETRLSGNMADYLPRAICYSLVHPHAQQSTYQLICEKDIPLKGTSSHRIY